MYHCNLCARSYVWPQNLQRHIRNRHKDDTIQHDQESLHPFLQQQPVQLIQRQQYSFAPLQQPSQQILQHSNQQQLQQNQPLLQHKQPSLQHNQTPLQHNQPFLQHNQPLLQPSQQPLQQNQQPLQHNQPLLQHNQPLLQHNQPLLQPSQPPLQQNQQPLQHNQPPLQHNQPLLQLNQPPMQHNQNWLTPFQQEFTFQHPFTCMVSGPTSCGKTYFVSQLLEKAGEIIRPPPQRIIWLYKRWQPLYDYIQRIVTPRVEFIRGIPLNLDRDNFLDVRVNNLIVLDDMASEAAKDPRVTDLFLEGSHHRNLSVIALHQNLYYNKDPTSRRNCHYLVVFNNPADRQEVRTLARQMYPGSPHHLLRHFEDAIGHPYGYLLIDLKPTTPESMRLRTNVLENRNETHATGKTAPCMPLDGDYPSTSTRREDIFPSNAISEAFSNYRPQIDRRCPITTTDDAKEKPCRPWLTDLATRSDSESYEEETDRDDEEIVEDKGVDFLDSDEDSIVGVGSMDESTGSPDPYSNVEKWTRHFRKMAEGRVHPNHKGHYLVEDVQRGLGRRGDQDLSIPWVTPIAQAIDIARSQVALRKKKQLSVPKTRTGVKRRADTPIKDFSMRPPGIPDYK